MAKLDKAPVSKTGDSRFESWLPRLPATQGVESERPLGNNPRMGVVAFVLFFLAGLGFGYSLTGPTKFIPLIFPILLALGAFVQWGLDGAIVARLIVALVATLLGILLGTLLAVRGERREAAGAA